MEDRKEVPRTLQKYLNDSKGFMSALGDSDEIQKFCWFIKNGVIVTTDHPDAFVKIGNEILIIEHFAIDGYEEKEHAGSLAAFNERAIHARFTKQESVNGSKQLTARLGVKNSYQQFLDNCYRRFEHHYQQIENYKNHLREEHIADNDSQYTICFLMDEVSPLGTLTVDDDGKINPVCLGYSKEFLDYFDNKPDVDWIISAIIKPGEDSVGWKYQSYFFSRNDISKCRERIVDYARFQFLESDPCITEVELEIRKQYARVGDILHMEKGKIPSATAIAPKEGYLPYVDIKAFEKGIVDRYASVQNAVLCNDGDLLIVCDGSRSGLTGKAIKGVVGSTLSKVYADGLTTDYLRYYLQSKYELLNTRKKGTGTPHLNADLVKEASIYVPSVDEQNHIVLKIEELFSELDAGVETLQKIKQQLLVYRQAVLKEAFGKCKQHVSVNSVCSHVTDGDHLPPPKEETGIPFIMISNIEDNHINWNNTAYVGRAYYDSISDKRRPQKGDVLYTVTGSFGIPVMIDFDKEFCFQRHIALLRPNERIEQKFLFYAMQDPTVYAQADKRSTGTAQKTVGLAVLRDIQIPFCESKSDQMRLISKIEQRLESCKLIEKDVNHALQQSAAMRQSILKQAFEGGL